MAAILRWRTIGLCIFKEAMKDPNSKTMSLAGVCHLIFNERWISLSGTMGIFFASGRAKAAAEFSEKQRP
jgi:hypothetical protein